MNLNFHIPISNDHMITADIITPLKLLFYYTYQFLNFNRTFSKPYPVVMQRLLFET